MPSDSLYWFPRDQRFDHLHGKSVQFDIAAAEICLSGIGQFRVRERETGEQAIDILTTLEQFSTARATHVFGLLPSHVASIVPHADPMIAEYHLDFDHARYDATPNA